jgi:hypothetical protein
MLLARMLSAVLPLGLCLAVFSCAKAQPGQGPSNGNLLTVYKAPESRFDRTVREVVTDSGTWRALWDSISGFGGPHPLPVVDFQAAILLVAAGPRVGAGDSVLITDVHSEGSGLKARVITYRHCLPPDVSPVPVHVVQVPPVGGQVRFDEDTASGPMCLPSP